MSRSRAQGVWAIIAGICINNLSYLVDLAKDHTGVIILGPLSLTGIAAGIALVLLGIFMLVRMAPAGQPT